MFHCASVHHSWITAIHMLLTWESCCSNDRGFPPGYIPTCTYSLVGARLATSSHVTYAHVMVRHKSSRPSHDPVLQGVLPSSAVYYVT